MAFYTPPSLPRTPSYCSGSMTSTLPSLPTELLSTWSMWRNSSKEKALLTPPMSSTLHRRRAEPQPQVASLPPISDLDLRLSAMPPLTPPRSGDLGSSSKLPLYNDYDSHYEPSLPLPMPITPDYIEEERLSIPSVAAPVVDWLDFTRERSAGFIAEKTCEMICYLWFASTPSSPTTSPSRSPSNSSPSYRSHHKPATNPLQLHASTGFVHFMQKLLETTQVSQSVIVLSLHYIYRLKERNCLSSGQPGSEFRIAVAGLMMANKFLDDNTYTNKTWSEVSGIELNEINRMEREFLAAVQFSLYVDKATYESWLNLLKGLVMAKEKASRRLKRTRAGQPSIRPLSYNTSVSPTRPTSSKYRIPSFRARSTSPDVSARLPLPQYPFVFSAPHPSNSSPPANSGYTPTPQPGSKRSAVDAFSPTSSNARPSKRPTSMFLEIPETRSASGPSSAYSPLENLCSFDKMTLQSSPRPHMSHDNAPSTWDTSFHRDSHPHTLAASYAIDEQQAKAIPQNLYFYTLACSPLERDEESDVRKARLRYHQPPPPKTLTGYLARPTMPLNVQSACTSPHDIHMSIAPSLPRFQDYIRSRNQPFDSNPSHHYPSPRDTLYTTSNPDGPIPSAPFANAGPPGVQFYTTSQKTSPVFRDNWSRGRRY